MNILIINLLTINNLKKFISIVLFAVFGLLLHIIYNTVISTITPIFVFVLSAIIIKERIVPIKIFGVLLGFAGALGLILFGEQIQKGAPNIVLGNIMLLTNATSYGIYLILVKPLTAKYHSFTIMKWLFLIAIFINFPLTFSEFKAVEWSTLPFDAIWRMAFVVLGTTFSTYLLNIYALKQLKASTIGAFVYLQPLIGIFFAILVGADNINLVRIIAAILVFIGVYLVTKTRKETN